MTLSTRFLAAGFLLATTSLHAQVFPYEFTVFSDPYFDLTAPSSISNEDVWDDPSYFVSTGFDVQLFDEITNVLGILQPGAQVVSINEANPDTVQVICPYMADIMNANDSMAVSPISYQLEGPPGNAVLKLEWKNVGFYGEWDAANTYFNTTNFQIWLYQNAPIIEYRYGPNTIKSGGLIHFFGTGPLVLLANNALLNGTGWDGLWCVSGNPSSPVITSIPSGQQPLPGQELNSEPQSGTVYRFSLLNSAVAESAAAGFNLWPTTCTDHINLMADHDTVIRFYDAMGREIHAHRMNGKQTETIDVSSWSAGYYVAKTSNGNVVRFIKS
ncbi:MAG: T9SS type A sorting domain-containing protein [Flavobacteriales bacterium]|jgi:hypothetical protein